MNLIFQTIYDAWCRTKTKKSPSEWISRNCPFCEHRGQAPDKRGRGGLKHDNNSITLNCFNCGFCASWTIGRPLYPKMISALKWLNVDEKTINQLKLESLRISKESGFEPIVHIRRNIKPIVLPADCTILESDSIKHQKHIDFLKTRGFTPEDFSFLVSPDLTYRSRVILPFILQDTIIGYSARSIISNEKMRYIMKETTEFVFGVEWVEPEHEWIIVTEGLFDALSVKCLAVMHNEISEAQTEMICDLQRRVIIVPDLDKAGLANRKNSLINTALDCGWEVAFPTWEVKDINAAYVNYGPLFTIKHILDCSTNNPTKIRVQQKMLLNGLKSNI